MADLESGPTSPANMLSAFDWIDDIPIKAKQNAIIDKI